MCLIGGPCNALQRPENSWDAWEVIYFFYKNQQCVTSVSALYFSRYSINTHCHRFSPSFHAPAPISDNALTLIMYSTPASSPVRIVEFAGGETARRVELSHDSVSLVLYSTSYSVIGNSLWGVVQDTVTAKFPSSTDLVTDTLVTLGSVNRMLEWSIPLH